MDIHEKIVEMMSASHLTQQKLAEKLGYRRWQFIPG